MTGKTNRSRTVPAIAVIFPMAAMAWSLYFNGWHIIPATVLSATIVLLLWQVRRYLKELRRVPPADATKARFVDHELTARFVQLLERQSKGDATAEKELHALQITQLHGQCLFDLYGEWSGAFCYSPGRREILAPLLDLARWLKEEKRDDINQKNDRPEWGEIIELRGPAETVQFRKCSKCGFVRASMGTSGFYDAIGLLCCDCGNAYFKADCDESETPSCECGGVFAETWPCVKCSDEHYENAGGMSPYEYFSKHSYSRGEGA